MVGVSGIGLATSDATWLGATDDRVAAVAVETYADFLRRVAAAIGLMAGVEWIGLAIVTLGLLQLFKTRRDHRPSRRLRVHATRFALALLVTLLFWGWAAGRHPGLFLGILATSRIAAMWSQACWLLAPIGAGASVVGYLVAASISSRRVQIAFVALAAVTGAVTGRCLSWSKAYLSEPFAIAKVVRLGQNANVAIPFFQKGVEGRKAGDAACADEDLKLSVLSALALPSDYDNAKIGRAVASGVCFDKLRPAIEGEFKDSSAGYYPENACSVLKAKNAL